ncbi:1-(5-phosphoribosyl)-5-amino-4-imidazole- carboxylate (AIR) carboxylase [Methanothermus fervidus DSM 2088]|uniref:1-(5-phosphoribosyl)-5-amino-4-imidazole-carboxylate (AIR) carboxylase n=1 Tax=Methanothermus fervidus (strain ATCC 43054 / DSM 2088 / JCM 10308 / V24 S) TaxID=523846 RepID=E3GWU6_METFV|nr:nickel pincer cofactor biosynthesis protein LarB [Methanothermus fervidus]ADP78015.1 1-(5-phosphoribosyl)-5-amino-4-imidazole- carboxylate (AIR) carboxylase [Methanothermus fervidus DSM 2088]
MREILKKLADGKISIKEAEKLIKSFQIKEIEDLAKFDLGREVRTGIPEVVLSIGKSPEKIAKIIKACGNKGLIITRLNESKYKKIVTKLPKNCEVRYYKEGRVMIVGKHEKVVEGHVGIITGGTADIPVAEEAKIILEEMGCKVSMVYDVGIAGIHRLFRYLRKLIKKNVQLLIVVAGMEGALPSVVAGLVDLPVIAVPTSVGYGAGGKGIAALLSMLQSCVPGVVVVNIDNGFGAAAFALKILKQINSPSSP